MSKRVVPRRARPFSQCLTIDEPRKRRGALLASTAFTGAFIAVIAGHPTGALAACSGINTASVLCDAANQATAGTLTTTFAGATTVNVNAGGKIDTGGAMATVTGPGNLTFNNNDTTFGIKGGASIAVRLSHNGAGQITYLGNANVTSTGNTAMAVTKNGGTGDILITNNATVTSQPGGSQGVFAQHLGIGNITINGSGSFVGPFNGINATQQGTSGGITIGGSGDATGTSNLGLGASIFNFANGSDVLVNRSGNVSGNTGILAATQGVGKVTVTGFGTVTATTGTAILVEARGGDITVTGGGNVTSTGGFGITASAVNSGHIDIAPAGTVTGTRGIIANTSFGLANGTSTVTVSKDVTATAGPGVHTLSGTGLATVNVIGGTINARGSMIGSIADGITHQGNGGLLLNMTGGQIGTTATRTGAGGIRAEVARTVGGIDITSTNVFSSGTSIGATLSGATSRNIAITTNGVTDSFSGAGISAFISNAGATGNIAITQNGAINGADGIVATNVGSGSIAVTANAPITAPIGVGIGVFGGTGNTVINNGSINAYVGVRTTGGTTVINRGSITGNPGEAVVFAGSNNTFVMEGPGVALNGTALGGSTDTFRLAGDGSNSFNVAQIIGSWGLLAKTGSSNWTLTGTATHTGAVTVNEGTLTVNGSLASASSITVASGATLGGSGTLPSTTINAGGVLAPGNSIGVVNINGTLVLGAGAIYRVEVSPVAADRTNVTGSATLTGATVQLSFSPGLYVNRHYTILSAAGGLGGTTFSGVSGANFNASLSYTPTDVLLNISPALGAGTGTTRNQQNVADAINTATINGTLPPALGGVFALTSDALGSALSALSGEVHASTPGVLADESLYVRSAILGRLRQASYGSEMAAMAALSLGGPQIAFAEEPQPLAYAESPIVTKAPPRAEPDTVFWAQGFGAWGRFESDGNAVTVRRDLAGVITGVDTRVGGNGRVGIAAGYTGSKNALDGRGSANVETAHIAGYGGWSFGALNLRAGGAYAFHSIATDRTIAFPGFFDRAFANYDGSTGQVFGELGYGVAFGSVAVEPFAGAAWVRVKTDAAAERGGLAALNVAGTSFETGYMTLGIRAASIVPLAADLVLIPRATLAWQHAFDNVTPGNVLALQAAPIPFAISGVPIARDSALAEAGLDLVIGRNATIGVSYTGQIASNVQDHAAKGKFSWKF